MKQQSTEATQKETGGVGQFLGTTFSALLLGGVAGVAVNAMGVGFSHIPQWVLTVAVILFAAAVPVAVVHRTAIGFGVGGLMIVMTGFALSLGDAIGPGSGGDLTVMLQKIYSLLVHLPIVAGIFAILFPFGFSNRAAKK